MTAKEILERCSSILNKAFEVREMNDILALQIEDNLHLATQAYDLESGENFCLAVVKSYESVHIIPMIFHEEGNVTHIDPEDSQVLGMNYINDIERVIYEILGYAGDKPDVTFTDFENTVQSLEDWTHRQKTMCWKYKRKSGELLN